MQILEGEGQSAPPVPMPWLTDLMYTNKYVNRYHHHYALSLHIFISTPVDHPVPAIHYKQGETVFFAFLAVQLGKIIVLVVFFYSGTICCGKGRASEI